MNQFFSIWNDVGGTQAGLQSQFDSVQIEAYWSGTVYAPDPTKAWYLTTFNGYEYDQSQGNPFLYAVAVRPGDVAVSVPERQMLALALLALGATVVVRRRRRA